MTHILNNPFDQPVDVNSTIYPGALLHVYKINTTDDAGVWQDKDKNTTHPNPVVADANGQFPVIWVEETVDLRLETSASVLIDTAEDINAFETETAAQLAQSNGALFAQDVDTTSGLTFGYQAGRIDNGNGTTTLVAAGTVSLTDNILNYVYLDYATNTVQVSTSTPGSNTTLLFEVTTATGAITLVSERATPYSSESARAFPKGYITGFPITIDSGDADHNISVGIGSARDQADALGIVLASAMIKDIENTWVAGTGNGGRPTAVSLSANTRYYIFVIVKSDGTVDAGIDSSATAANLISESSYNGYRLVGYCRTNSSSNLSIVWDVPREGQSKRLIDAINLTNESSVDFVNDFVSTELRHVTELDSVVANATTNILIRTSTNGGSSFSSGGTDYRYAGIRTDNTPSTTDIAAITDAIGLFGGNQLLSGEQASFTVNIRNAMNSSANTFFDWVGGKTNRMNLVVSGARQAAEANNALQVSLSSGNFTSGVIKLYEVD